MRILFDVDTLSNENYIGKISNLETVLITTNELSDYFKEIERVFSDVKVERFESRELAESYIKLQMMQDEDYLFTKDFEFAKSLKCGKVSTNINLLLAFVERELAGHMIDKEQSNVIQFNNYYKDVRVEDDKFKILLRG